MIDIREIVESVSFNYGVYNEELNAVIKFHVVNIVNTLKKQHIDKYGYDPQMQETINVKLNREQMTGCDTNGCYYLVSEKEVPNTIRDTDNLPYISVTDIYGNIFNYTPFEVSKFRLFDKFTSKHKRYFLRNSKLVVLNTQLLSEIKITGIFEESQRSITHINISRDYIPVIVQQVLQLVPMQSAMINSDKEIIE